MIEDLGESIYKIRTSSSIYSEAMDPQADTGSPASYPDFKGTAVLDDLRDTEYSYLEEHVYRDYTGAGLAAQSQHRVSQHRLITTLFGNPHSENPTSEAATQLVEATRRCVLQHFNASPNVYTAIFTPNASGAALIVGESYPFKRRKGLVLTSDNYNSINGLRDFAKKHHTSVTYVRTRLPDLWVLTDGLKRALKKSSLRGSRGSSKLFAYPAQRNFSGVRHPLEWVSQAQDCGYDALLDAAAYIPTATLDLSPTSDVRPDFVTVSWYKMFGYPTGIGCLIVRNEALSRLSRPWFSGGTIQAVSVGLPRHIMATGAAAFGDGTANFLSIPDISVGLDWIVGIGLDVISTRVRCLTGWFLDRLTELRHSDGSSMVQVYGPTNTTMRDGTVAFNFLDAAGKVVDERLVAKESSEMGMLRTGCFCNPGCGEDAFQLDVLKMLPLMLSRETDLATYLRLIGSPSPGAVHASFGFASSPKDIDRFFAWAEPQSRSGDS